MNEIVHVNGQWATRLVDFNVHVARIAHRSWIPESVQPLLFDAQGALQPRAEKWVSQWLLETHDLEREMDWQMDEPQKRIWLLDSPSLVRLARELSVVMHRDWLLQVIDGPRLREVRSRVDPVLWRLMVEEMTVDAPHHAQPQVSFLGHTPQEVEADLLEDGARMLTSLLMPEWRAVCGRARLRFKAKQDGDPAGHWLPPHGLGDGHDLEGDRVMELIRGWLVPRRLPQWAWLF